MELLNLIRQLSAAIKAKDYGTILLVVSQLTAMLSGFFSPIKAGSTAPALQCADADLDAALAELQSAANGYSVPAMAGPEGDKANMDPATILMIVQLVGTIIGMFRKK